MGFEGHIPPNTHLPRLRKRGFEPPEHRFHMFLGIRLGREPRFDGGAIIGAHQLQHSRPRVPVKLGYQLVA